MTRPVAATAAAPRWRCAPATSPFMVEHRQPVCKLGLERMSAPAERLYGASLGSNYQGQVTMLSKHFEEQTAGSGSGSADG